MYRRVTNEEHFSLGFHICNNTKQQILIILCTVLFDLENVGQDHGIQLWQCRSSMANIKFYSNYKIEAHEIRVPKKSSFQAVTMQKKSMPGEGKVCTKLSPCQLEVSKKNFTAKGLKCLPLKKFRKVH